MTTSQHQRAESPASSNHRYVDFEGFRYDRDDRVLTKGDTEIPLLPKAADFLHCLLEHAGSIVSKDTLLEEVWDGSHVSETALFQAVSTLRHALEDDPRNAKIIETVHKRGYRFIAPLTVVAPPAQESGDEASVSRLGAGAADGGWLRRRRTLAAIGALACLAAGAAVGALALRWWTAGDSQPRSRLEVPIALPVPICSCNQPNLALSADGTQLAYIAHGGEEHLYLLSLEDLSRPPRSLASGGPRNPFFSPDGNWVGYFEDRWLYKVSVRGGPPVRLCPVEVGRRGGASWGTDGTIVFSMGSGSGLWAVADIGGTPRQLTEPDVQHGEFSHLWPEVLPSDHDVLFTIERKGASATGEGRLVVLSMDTGEITTVIEDGGSTPQFARNGQIVFARDGSLMSLAFDPSKLVARGPAVPIVDDLLVWPENVSNFALADNGLLAYLPAGALESEASIVSFDRDGNGRSLPIPAVDADRVALSPDGRKLAFTAEDDVWVYETDRETLTRVAATDSRELTPIWRPDTSSLVFSSNRDGPYQLFECASNSSLAPRKLVGTQYDTFVGRWSPDGRVLSFSVLDPETGWDIWLYAPDDDPALRPFYRTPFHEVASDFSPDGRWISYMSNENGLVEAFVQPFPATGHKWQVSHGGGRNPVWAPTGNEIYFHREAEAWVVPVVTGRGIELGTERRVFEAAGAIVGLETGPDADSVLATVYSRRPSAERLHLVLEW